MNVEILFVGGLFPDEIKDQIFTKSRGVIQNSANTFQWAFLNGIEQNLKRPVSFITAPFVGYFPKYYSDVFVKPHTFKRGDVENGTSIGFINLPVIKKAFICRNLKRNINKWAASKTGDQVVIVYSMNYSYLKAVVKSKKTNPKIKICLIVADLPDFPTDADNLYGLYLKNVEKPLVYRLLKSVDSFVFLTDKMSPLLNINKCPWVRIEGLYDVSLEVAGDVPKEHFTTILYSGSIDARYGIKELIGAFNLINADNYRLWICGGGISQDFVEKSQITDSRIKFLGNLSRQKVLELQRMATVLINPRNTIGDYNEYSFPSKTMEYLASGTPAIIYRLPGIPDEYFDHCFVVPDNSIKTLASFVKYVCELSASLLQEKGEKARDFILKNKNPKIQCAKAVDMLYSLYKKQSQDLISASSGHELQL